MEYLTPRSFTPNAHFHLKIEDAIDRALLPAAEAGTWNYYTAPATLVSSADGHPIRSIITGRKSCTTGVYASLKAGRSLPYESMNERAFFMHSEVDTSVVDYRAQPFRLEFLVDGMERAYIPDCVRLLNNGSLEVVEIKNDRRAIRDPDYALKIQTAKEIFQSVGWNYRIVYSHDLFEPPLRWQTIQDIQSWKTAQISQSEIFAVVSAITRNYYSLGQLSHLIGAEKILSIKLKAMSIRRIVSFDISGPLSHNTIITLIDDQREII